jgi:enoyl-CoA hydratase/carnithine racemase
MSDLEYAVADGVATIRLNRPERRNAFTLAMIDAWREHLRCAEDDDNVSVVVVTGAGNAFCSGIDLSALRGLDEPLDVVLTERIHGVARAMESVSKPVIAAVRGPAVGAGMDMALMCDMRIADSTATFCEKYVDVGILPGDGGAWLLPRIVGRSRALHLLWTAQVVSAEEAYGWGLVDVLVPDGQLPIVVAQLAETLAAKRPDLLRTIKSLVRAGADTDMLSALNAVAREQRRLRARTGVGP